MEEKELSTGFDISRLFRRILSNYFWFLFTIPVLVGGAYLYLKYSVPLFQVVSYLQIQPPNEGQSLIGGSPFSSSGQQANNLPDMNGEVFKLQSTALFEQVVDSLRLDIEVSAKGKVKNQPMQVDSLPFVITTKRTNVHQSSEVFDLRLNKSGFELVSSNKKISGIYDKPFVVNGDSVLFQLRDSAAIGQTYTFQLKSKKEKAAEILGRFTVGPVPKGGSGMLQLTLKDEITSRAKMIIEVLIDKYDGANQDFKTKSLKSEMAFLDNRLNAVARELETQENTVRDFKASNKINNVSASADQLLTSLTDIDKQKNDNKYKETLLSNIENYIRNRPDEKIQVAGVQDGELLGLVSAYNGKLTERASVLAYGAAQDLRLPPINTKIEDLKRSIENRINSLREELGTSNSYLAERERSTNSRFVTLPEKEKNYIEVNRLLNVKQTLYVFLLQRKEDKNIEFASSGFGGSRIVDWKFSNMREPRPLFIYAGALGAAILLPLLIIVIAFISNRKIDSFEDIYKSTAMPVAGEISYLPKNKENIVITEDNVSAVAEQFRTLRTNFFYLSKQLANKVVMVTSSISGEGKSFVSLNLGNSIAISGKKIVLLEFDLRNPTLSDKVNLEDKVGIHNYLSGEVSIEEIVNPVEGYPNLYFISAGTPLTPNPGEIILSNKMPTMFEYLRANFDYIILDTPPIEAVSDSLTMSKYVDSTFYIVRHKYSNKSSLTLINQLYKDKKLPNSVLVINGIKAGDGYRNAYGYGYGQKAKIKKKKGFLRIASIF